MSGPLPAAVALEAAPWVARMAGRMGDTFETRAELRSEGALALVEAWTRYDGRAGCAFGSFAWHRVRGAMLDWIERSSARLAVETPFDADARFEPASRAESPLARLLRRERRARLFARLRDPRERRVIEAMFWEGKSARDLARELGCCWQRVCQFRRRALDRLAGRPLRPLYVRRKR